MKQLLTISGFVLFLLFSCKKDLYSPDYFDPSLLPDTEDYTNTDFGTQELAKEIAEAYSSKNNDTCRIGLVIYDSDTRTERLMSLTGANWPIEFRPLKNGMLEFGYTDFQTEIMPLKMTAKINLILKLNTSQDTIWLSGTDGTVQTAVSSDNPIGTPVPESDEAEFSGFYVRETGQLSAIFDLMLPIAIKAHINGKY